MENFSKKQIHYSLFGNLLGSSYLRKNITTYHWIESKNKKDYIEWLEKIYKDWGLKTISKYNLGSYSKVSCKLKTNRHLEFKRMFNNENKKIFSNYVSKRISVFGLLLWYLDDGILNVHIKTDGSVSRYALLSTEKFSYNCHLKIQNMFKERFNIDVKIYTSKNKKFYIYFNAINFRLFYDLVRPYINNIPKSLYYKFNMKYNSKNIDLLNYNLV